jgi:transposase-like protein
VHSYHGGDPAEFPQASVGFDFDAVDESLALHDRRADQERRLQVVVAPMRTSDALFKFIALVIDSNDYRLEIDVAIAAIGHPLYQGCSFTDMAKKHGISKQAFDKRVIRFQKDFQLPITRAQKSTAARASYQRTQVERLARLKEKNQQLKKGNEEVWQNSSVKRAEKVSAG